MLPPGILLLRKQLDHTVMITAYAYVLGLPGWYVLKLLFGDRWWWLFVLNSSPPYLFLPLPVVLLWGAFRRKHLLVIGAGIGCALAFFLYGDQFRSREPADLPPDSVQLTVMTANVLADNGNIDKILDVIRQQRPDVVAVQELSPTLARAFQELLRTEYPYQLLDPRPEVRGLGLLSRYPLTRTETILPGAWIGHPQVVTLDLDSRPVTLINFHAIATLSLSWNEIEQTASERVRQTRALQDVAAASPFPVIAFGDLNATDQSGAYARLSPGLTDAWLEAGQGLGHTFSGPQFLKLHTPYGLIGRLFPMWTLRIDYIFHSRHWQTTSCRTGPWDGISDHRPVVATLALQPS